MSNRLEFMGQLLSGMVALAATKLPPSSRVLGANDPVRFGLIGAGDRGREIFEGALRCPNTEAVAVADVYTHRLNQARNIAP